MDLFDLHLCPNKPFFDEKGFILSKRYDRLKDIYDGSYMDNTRKYFTKLFKGNKEQNFHFQYDINEKKEEIFYFTMTIKTGQKHYRKIDDRYCIKLDMANNILTIPDETNSKTVKKALKLINLANHISSNIQEIKEIINYDKLKYNKRIENLGGWLEFEITDNAFDEMHYEHECVHNFLKKKFKEMPDLILKTGELLHLSYDIVHKYHYRWSLVSSKVATVDYGKHLKEVYDNLCTTNSMALNSNHANYQYTTLEDMDTYDLYCTLKKWINMEKFVLMTK